MNRRVLFIDDEPNVLEAYRRQLRRRFEIGVAGGGQQALTILQEEEPFAVIVSDLNMPGMDGIQLLTRTREQHPDTVRVMLTGQADLERAIEAVNRGGIFRFLTKPCPPDLLLACLEAGVEQHRLITAERELLEQTLAKSVGVLTELLGLVNPTAASRAARVKKCALQLVESLEPADRWEYEVAATLSQVGCVILSPDTLSKLYAGQPLTPDERESFASHPEVGAKLLAGVPRLERVAAMIAGQCGKPAAGAGPESPGDWDAVELGGEILRCANEFELLTARGVHRVKAVEQLGQPEHGFPAFLLAALGKVRQSREGLTVRTVTVSQLNTFMIFDEDVKAKSGLLLVTRGQEVGFPVLERLRTFARGVGVVEPIRVLERAPETPSAAADSGAA